MGLTICTSAPATSQMNIDPISADLSIVRERNLLDALRCYLAHPCIDALPYFPFNGKLVGVHVISLSSS